MPVGRVRGFEFLVVLEFWLQQSLIVTAYHLNNSRLKLKCFQDVMKSATIALIGFSGILAVLGALKKSKTEQAMQNFPMDLDNHS